MAGLSTGLKQKLKISPCTVDLAGNITVADGDSFEVMLNPTSFSHTHSISYNTTEAMGQTGSDTKYSGTKPEKISFDLVIDGTGVVNLPIAGVGSPDVKTQVGQLGKLLYIYDGEKHEPNHVRLLWGSLIFFGRLESMSVDYTLFKPSGEPLRAKIKLAFAGFMSKEEEALRAKRSSPDLSHQIEVKAGDTLPMLCYRVYKDCTYYLEVARINSITNVRDIKPGSKLHFPPLR
jgi:hypothetical protein